MIITPERMDEQFCLDQLRADEYWDQKTGLIFCCRCHTPRQVRVPINGITWVPRCLCACESADLARREKERKHQDFLDHISKNRNVGLTDPQLRMHTFENDLGYNPKQMDMAKNYVLHWEEARRESQGLLLWGDVGTGKSYVAGCIANALLDKGVPVMMTNFTRILNRLTELYSRERNAYIDSFNAYDLLIIDDLGVERDSEFAREQVFSVIDSRYRSQLPMIVTTNLPLEELKNPRDLARARIYDRVMERCAAIMINNQNIRKHNTKENMAKTKAMLEG